MIPENILNVTKADILRVTEALCEDCAMWKVEGIAVRMAIATATFAVIGWKRRRSDRK